MDVLQLELSRNDRSKSRFCTSMGVGLQDYLLKCHSRFIFLIASEILVSSFFPYIQVDWKELATIYVFIVGTLNHFDSLNAFYSFGVLGLMLFSEQALAVILLAPIHADAPSLQSKKIRCPLEHRIHAGIFYVLAFGDRFRFACHHHPAALTSSIPTPPTITP